MSNPIRESVRFLWEKMRGRYYYPSQDAHTIALNYLTREVQNFAYSARLYDLRIIADMVQRENITPHYSYRHFKKAKANGSFRDIHEPDEQLKAIQQNLLKFFRTSQKDSIAPSVLI